MTTPRSGAVVSYREEYADAKIAVCAYCGAPAGKPCISYESESKSWADLSYHHHSRWQRAQGVEIARLRAEIGRLRK